MEVPARARPDGATAGRTTHSTAAPDASGIGARLRSWRTHPDPIDPDHLADAIVAHRAHALAWGLLSFLVGFSLDDVGVFRLPAYLLGIGAALFWFAFGALLLGRRFAADPRRFRERLEARRRTGALLLLGTVLVFLVWLAVFSEGVPPWA